MVPSPCSKLQCQESLYSREWATGVLKLCVNMKELQSLNLLMFQMCCQTLILQLLPTYRHLKVDEGSAFITCAGGGAPTIVLKGCTFTGCSIVFSGPSSNVSNE